MLYKLIVGRRAVPPFLFSAAPGPADSLLVRSRKLGHSGTYFIISPAPAPWRSEPVERDLHFITDKTISVVPSSPKVTMAAGRRVGGHFARPRLAINAQPLEKLKLEKELSRQACDLTSSVSFVECCAAGTFLRW